MMTTNVSALALILAGCLAALACGAEAPGEAHAAGVGKFFKGPVGIQLYSLRDQFSKDVPGTLDKVKQFGFQYVELAGTYGKEPAEFKAMLEERGLKPVSGHWGYGMYRDQLDKVVEEAKLFGVKYAGCAWIDHEGDFDEKTCREAIAVFNRAGEALAKHGIQFFYHTHGYEFQPYEKGTLFDLLASETKPELVAFEMDVFWIVHPGLDPAALLGRYPGRFQLTHLKDMQKDTPTGLLTGSSDPANDVALGTGKINFPPLLAAAEKVGVKWHFLEDESPRVEEQIPVSLRYLENVTW